jgi:hypothetical protein
LTVCCGEAEGKVKQENINIDDVEKEDVEGTTRPESPFCIQADAIG